MADGQEQKMSLAFTFQKKKVVQRVAANVEERKDVGQLISGIEGATIQVVGGDSAAEVKTLVIPKIENTYKSGGPKKFTPSYKPPSGDAKVDNAEERFVQAASTVPVITGYGLQLREGRPGNRDEGAGPADGAGGSTTAAAMESRNFRDSVEQLPDAMDTEAYEAMPIEEFGKAMLRGMGWEDGMGVGRNRRKVDAIEYVRRPDRLGLGALPVAMAPDLTKPVKMGDKPQRQDLVLAPDADGRQRNIRKLDEQLVARSTVLPGPLPGKAMHITGGSHAGMACTALEALAAGEGKQERWRVRLSASHEEVDVLVSELGEKWEREPGGGSGRRDRDSDAAAANGAGGRGGEANGRAPDGGREREAERGGSGRRGEGSTAAGEPSSRRSEGRDADDRQHDRSRDPGRHRDRERDGSEDGGGGGKRKQRDDRVDEPRPLGDEDGGREPKKSRGSDRGRRDEQYDDRDNGRDHHPTHHKHEKKDRKEKKEKKEKKDKKDKKDKKEKKDKDKERDRGRQPDERKAPLRGRGGSSDSGSDEEEEEDGAQRQPSGTSWLLPYIKVRIVDKAVRGGKLYLKKGTVVDVHPGAAADVAVDDTGDVLRLPQSSLETVVPRHEGAAVLVVAGVHRGSRGRLLHSSTASGGAAVQLAADLSVVRLLLDDVAAFVGELDEE